MTPSRTPSEHTNSRLCNSICTYYPLHPVLAHFPAAELSWFLGIAAGTILPDQVRRVRRNDPLPSGTCRPVQTCPAS